MSDTKHSDTIIKNEDTIQRRAWIDRAVASAKGCIGSEKYRDIADHRRKKPDLYVVRSNRSR